MKYYFKVTGQGYILNIMNKQAVLFRKNVKKKSIIGEKT